MSITVQEKPGGRTDAQSAEVLYLVFGDGEDAGSVTDEDAFEAVAGSATPTRNGFTGSNIEVRSELVPGRIWEVAATYGGSEPQANQNTTVDYEFSYQAPSQKIYQSIYTRGVYDADGLLDRSSHEELYFGAINVKNEEGKTSVEGVDLPNGSTTNTWIYKPRFADITTAYQLGVESLMGAVNAYPFKGRPARTMRLVSVDGGSSFAFGITPKWHIKFGFQYAANRSNFVAGGITIPFQAGHDLLWGYYADIFVNRPRFKSVLKMPLLMFVEQVFEEVNFASLGIS